MAEGEQVARQIAVLGNGGFGTALACHAHAVGHAVRLWGHDAAYAAACSKQRENVRYLPGIDLAAGILISGDAAHVLDGADIVLFVVPTQHVRGVADEVASFVPEDSAVVSCSKGLEESTGMRPTEVLASVLPGPSRFVLTGPCHAEELARGKPSSVVLAGESSRLASLQAELSGPTFRIYRTQDAVGAELGGAVKNVIALAAGICDGLDLGDNAKAAILTRGIAEMARFGVALGAQRDTFFGLAGIGDLITTSVSPHGRNRAFGERLARGETLEQILAATNQVAEGVWTCRAVLEKATTLNVSVPITSEVAQILFQQKPPRDAVCGLMTRTLREE